MEINTIDNLFLFLFVCKLCISGAGVMKTHMGMMRAFLMEFRSLYLQNLNTISSLEIDHKKLFDVGNLIFLE